MSIIRVSELNNRQPTSGTLELKRIGSRDSYDLKTTSVFKQSTYTFCKINSVFLTSVQFP
jgi:hypothetical protein